MEIALIIVPLVILSIVLNKFFILRKNFLIINEENMRLSKSVSVWQERYFRLFKYSKLRALEYERELEKHEK